MVASSNSLMALAILPGLLIIIYIMRKDKVEKEPVPLIIKLLILGAVACVPAAFLESAITNFLPYFSEGSLAYAITFAFCCAAMIEELCKLALLALGSWTNRAFNYRFDGVVYGVSIAVGFAVLENVMYVMQGGLATALMRAFLSVPLHAFCGVFMGALYAMAKKASVQHTGNSGLYLAGAYVIPVVIHGIYDTFCFWYSPLATPCLLGFVVGLYIVGIMTIRSLSKSDAVQGFYDFSLSDNGQNGPGGPYGPGGSNGQNGPGGPGGSNGGPM